MKARVATYVPAVKSDKIEQALAQYINNLQDKSKFRIAFMRESEGVYMFGTRRTTLKANNGKVQCKSGGGFITIDEFLQT